MHVGDKHCVTDGRKGIKIKVMRAGYFASGLAQSPAPFILFGTFRPFRRLGGGERFLKN